MPQVNISLDAETAASLDEMTREDAFDNRSAFIRRLIRLEARRRASRMANEDGQHAPTDTRDFGISVDME